MAVSIRPQPRALAIPTSNLSQALQSFESILTEDQKRQYQTSSSIPNASHIITFVSQIDAQNRSNSRRCVAQRLYTFLESTQQFADVVGTFVSSNPTIAALVWGSVQTAVVLVSNIGSYFDKVTYMIMTIGRPCPTFQKFGSLYPGSVSLQSALCDYYAVVIRLCTRIVEAAQRSGVVHTISAAFQPFEAEFKPLRQELDEASSDVQLQISLASCQAAREDAKLSALEREKNAGLRRSMSLFRKEYKNGQAEAQQIHIVETRQRLAKLREGIKSNLTAVNHIVPWKQAARQRVQGTADWFQQDQNFCMWKMEPTSAVLWCSGTLGAGKTILAANMVAHLCTSRKASDVVTYFFCQTTLADSCLAQQILGSIAAQILESSIANWNEDVLSKAYEQSKNLRTWEIVSFLRPHLEPSTSYYVVLDGLDECEASEIRIVVDAMNHLRSNRDAIFKVLYSGRPPLLQHISRNDQPDYNITLNEKNVDVDIKHYISTTLDGCLEDKTLRLGDPRLILKVKATLEESANGMFLWVRLLIEEVCAQNNDHEILEALRNIPRNLFNIYDLKTRRVRSTRQAESAINTLELCGVARRPLTVDETREALTIRVGQKSLDVASLSNDMEQIIADCCGLIYVDEEESTVHYVHQSVHQYLFDSSCSETRLFQKNKSDKNLGFRCLTYVNFTDFGRQLVKHNQNSSIKLDPLKIGSSALAGRSLSGARSAQLLLRRSRRFSTITTGDLSRMTQDLLGVSDSDHLEGESKLGRFQFLAYAQKYWIYHLSDLDRFKDEKMWRLFSKCVDGSTQIVSRPWETFQSPYVFGFQWMDSGKSRLPWLIFHRHSALLLWKLAEDKPPMTNQVRGGVLMHCCSRDDPEIINVLLQQTPGRIEELDRALLQSAERGLVRIVGRLIEAGANVNNVSGDWSALQLAAQGGHIRVVETLLAADADVNALPAYQSGRTALQAAAGAGHFDVVDLLLASNADIDAVGAPSGGGLSALGAAASAGNLAMVERLLFANADVNAVPAFGTGRTALQAAAEAGHLDVVDRLLTANADVNAFHTKIGGRTALQAAAGAGHLHVVERLLNMEADVNAYAIGGPNMTALQAAAQGGYLHVVKRLVAADADINAPACATDGPTALQAAMRDGHLKVADFLRKAGARA